MVDSNHPEEFLGLGIADYLAICTMLAISAAIGIYFRLTGGKQKTTLEFLMAGRNMGIFPVAFSLFATYMTTVSVMGTPAEIYLYGTQFALISIGTGTAILFSAFVLVPVYFDIKATTSYEYLEKRFGRKLRTIISGLYIVQWGLYMGVVIYGPALALNVVTGLDLYVSLIATSSVCTFYCSLGGLKAILWTDVFQAILMYMTIFSIPIGIITKIGSLQQVMDIGREGGRIILNESSIDPTVRFTIWNITTIGFLAGINFFGTSQSQIQRILSVNSLKKAQIALCCSIPMIILFNQICCWNGVMLYALFYDCDPVSDVSNQRVQAKDQLIPHAITMLYGKKPFLSGIFLSGIFAATLSTVSSAINAMATVTMEDFIKPYCACKKLTETWATFLSKVIVVAYGLLCLLLSIVVSNLKGVLEVAAIINSLVGGPITAVFLLGMLTTTAFEEGVLMALFLGILFAAWIAIGSQTSKYVYPHLPLRTDGCTSNSTEIGSLNMTFMSVWKNETLKEKDDSGRRNVQSTEDVFILYRISYMWFIFMCIIVTFLAGYVICYTTGRFFKKKPVDRLLITPFLRRWYF